MISQRDLLILCAGRVIGQPILPVEGTIMPAHQDYGNNRRTLAKPRLFAESRESRVDSDPVELHGELKGTIVGALIIVMVDALHLIPIAEERHELAGPSGDS